VGDDADYAELPAARRREELPTMVGRTRVASVLGVGVVNVNFVLEPAWVAGTGRSRRGALVLNMCRKCSLPKTVRGSRDALMSNDLAVPSIYEKCLGCGADKRFRGFLLRRR